MNLTRHSRNQNINAKTAKSAKKKKALNAGVAEVAKGAEEKRMKLSQARKTQIKAMDRKLFRPSSVSSAILDLGFTLLGVLATWRLGVENLYGARRN